jgi:hypothetical protein
MFLRRALLAVVLISMGVLKLPASPPDPNKNTLKIHFVGACDFIEYASGPVRVVLPAYINPFGKGGMRHQAFVRSGSIAYPMNRSLAIQIKDSQHNVIPAGPVERTTFDSLVYAMPKGSQPNPELVRLGVIFDLPAGGTLVPGEVRDVPKSKPARKTEYFFAPPDEPITDRKTRPLAADATFELKTVDPGPMSVLIGDVEFLVAFRNHEAEVMIGNLPDQDIFYESTYEPRCTDIHFLLHYTLNPPYDVTKSLVPRLESNCDGASKPGSPTPTPPSMQTVGVDSFGAHDDCYPARWEM